MYGYIYKTTNNVNGKIYIGQHRSDDFDPNYYGSGKILKRAIKKYGIESFSVSVLTYCNSKSEMDSLERQFIKIYDSRNPSIGYNIAYGGEGGDLVSCLNEEDYKKFCDIVSENNKQGIIGNKGKNLSEQHKKKIGDGNRGKKHNKEWVDKQRAKVTGLTAWNKGLTRETDERVKKYARKPGEYHHSEETRKKISENVRGKYKPPADPLARNKKISEALKGRKLPEDLAKARREVAVGRIWIHNDNESRMIYPNELNTYEKLGYMKGRGKIK